MTVLAQERVRAAFLSPMVKQVPGWGLRVCNQQQAVAAL